MNTRNAIIFDKSLQSACQFNQSSREPLEPLSHMETARSYDYRWFDPARVGYFDCGRELRRAGLFCHASSGFSGYYSFHLTGEPRL
ncbi:hypothetical protein ACFL4Z_00610 [candidate division KSB1 bacterium]